MSHLVGLDEPDEHGEEHGGRSCFTALAKVLHGGLVNVLKDRSFSSCVTCSDLQVGLKAIGVDLGRFPVGHQREEQLAVAAQERAQNRIFVLCGELSPRQLHPSLQNSQVLQDAVQRHWTETEPTVFDPQLLSECANMLHANIGGILASLLTQRSLVQEVQLRVEVVDVWVSLLDDIGDEVQQRLFPVGRFSIQQLKQKQTLP